MARLDPPSAFQSRWNFLPTSRVLTNSAIDFGPPSVMPEIPLLCGGLLSGSPFVMWSGTFCALRAVPLKAGAFLAAHVANRDNLHIFFVDVRTVIRCHLHPMARAVWW